MENRNHAARKDPSERIHYGKRKYAAPIGLVYILLAVIGLAAVIWFCVRFTYSLLDNTQERERFEKIITPVVMFDPAPFENAADADPLFLLQSSLWSTLLGEKRESYLPDPNDPNNPMGNLVVPASDVDVTCDRLFGPEVKLQHQGFGNYETVYEYQDGIYYVPVSGEISMYSPSVERVVKSGDVYTLTVGYIPPSNPWTQAISGETDRPAAAKYMTYELTRVKDHFQLTAIRDDLERTQEAIYGAAYPDAGSEPSAQTMAPADPTEPPLSAPEIGRSEAEDVSSEAEDVSSEVEDASSEVEDASSESLAGSSEQSAAA